MDKITQVVAFQVFVMFTLIIMGYILTKKKIISKQGASDMSGILLTVVTPCVLIRSYQIKLDVTGVKGLAFSFAAAVLLHIILILLSKPYFSRVKDDEKNKIDRFASIYSNCGFMGIPLLEAALGSKGVFFGSAYLAVFNIFAWTHGLRMFSDKKTNGKLKSLILNPGIIGSMLALLLYFLQIRLPGVLNTVVGYTADLNTPLAMILIGSFLARTNILSTFKNVQMYFVALFRLIISPVAAIIMFSVINVPRVVAMSILIGASCPSAALVALFAEKKNMDSSYGSRLSSVTTLFSVITIPLMVFIADCLIE